jgi:hypothetical protein
MVGALDLVCVNTHVIARLKIADVCGSARNALVFSRFRDRDRIYGLVVGLNDDIVLANSPHHPGERYRGLVPPAIRRLTSRIALRIRSAWISATGVSNAGGDDLAKTGKTSQQQRGQ